MQALKTLVIFMAVLIVVGLGLLVYGLATRTGASDGGDVDLEIADGCFISQSALSNGVLMLTLDGPADRGCQQFIFIEPQSGRIMTRLHITDSPTP